MRPMMLHRWAIDSRVLIAQWNTRPAGRNTGVWMRIGRQSAIAHASADPDALAGSLFIRLIASPIVSAATVLPESLVT